MFKVVYQVLSDSTRNGLKKVARGMEKQDLDNYTFKKNYSISIFNKLYLGDAIESVRPDLVQAWELVVRSYSIN